MQFQNNKPDFFYVFIAGLAHGGAGVIFLIRAMTNGSLALLIISIVIFAGTFSILYTTKRTIDGWEQ